MAALCGFLPPVGRQPAPGDLIEWRLTTATVDRTNFLLLSGHIHLAIIAVVDAFIGYQFYSTKCEAPGLAQFLCWSGSQASISC